MELAQAEIDEAGIEPAHISTLLMVDNWLPNSDMDEQRKFEPQKRIEENLARIRSDIEARRRRIEPVSDEDRAAHVQFLNRGVKFEPEDLGGFLAIDADACKGCSICTRAGTTSTRPWPRSWPPTRASRTRRTHTREGRRERAAAPLSHHLSTGR